MFTNLLKVIAILYMGSIKMEKSNKFKYEVISIPASGTIDLIYKYGIHAHPNTESYNYKKTDYFTFRKLGGIMEKIFTVESTIVMKPDDLNEISMYDIDEYTKNRLINYIRDRKNGFTFGPKDIPYKFYILKYEKELMHKPKKPRQNNQCYFTLKELESGKEYVDSISKVSKIQDISPGENLNHWTFLVNPKYWYIDDFLNSARVDDEIYYSIREYDKDKMKIGDMGVLRVGSDSTTKKELNGKNKLESGVYAIVEVTSDPEFKKDDDSEFYANIENANKIEWRVRIKVIKNLINTPIIFNEKNNAFLNKDKYLIKGHQAADMPLLKDTYDEVINLIVKNTSLFIYKDVTEEDKYNFGDSKGGIEALNKFYEKVDIKKKEKIIKIVERGRIASEFKKYIGFKCQICEALNLNSYSFKKKNGEYYVEAHHIIPVNEIDNTKLSVDNLICVCPNHHRQIHYGNVELISNNELYTEYKIDGELVKIEKSRFRTEE